jgi:hypothetical protein
VIRVEDLGFEGLCRIRHHLGRHRVGKIHGQESDINILQASHLRGVLRVASHIDPLVPEGNDVAVTHPLRVERLTRVPFMDKIVGGHGLDL